MKSLKEYISREESKGTYAELVLSTRSAMQLEEFCSNNGIPCINGDKLHCTVVYSRNPIDIDEQLVMLPVAASIRNFTVLPSTVSGKVALALSIESTYIVKLHEYFRSIGASYDYNQFRPHVTLNYDWTGFNGRKVAPPNFTLSFDKFNAEEIKVNWSADAKP